MAQFTKKAIIQTFLELLAHKSLDKITVKDIVDRCGINRNTFYYYYKDIYDLIEDIFQIEEQKIKQDHPKSDSFYLELKGRMNLILEYKPAIAHIFYSKSHDIFDKYLNAVSQDFISKYVREQAKTLSVSEENIRLVEICYAASLRGVVVKWVQNENGVSSETFIRKLSILYENTIRAALLALENAE